MQSALRSQGPSEPSRLPWSLSALDTVESGLLRLQQQLAQLDRDLRQTRADYRRIVELNRALSATGPNADTLLERLSRQERRVAEMLASGQTNRELAGDLHLTVHTVKSHVSSILRKLELRSRWELAGFLEGSAAGRRFGRPARGPRPGEGDHEGYAQHEDDEPSVDRVLGD